MSDDGINEFNRQVIEEFRAGGGRLGGPFENTPILLLHTVGAKSGRERVTPVAYRELGGKGLAVFASKGGAPTNPDWYHNLVAHPEVTVEVGGETRKVRARVAQGDERESIWEAQKRDLLNFADYEKKTSRQIPVVVLEPVE